MPSQTLELLAHFFAGIFLANGVPHFVNGICGNSFQTPFASPPAVGESSPAVNVLWGIGNFVLGSLLLSEFGAFGIGRNFDTVLFFSGALSIALILSWHFGRVRKAHRLSSRSAQHSIQS